MIQPAISAAFSRSREVIGYPSPSFVTRELGFTPEHPLHGSLRRHMYEHPTSNFLYVGARKAIKKILAKGDSVAIWTDEYRQRLESSGLHVLQELGDISFVAGEKKCDRIPDIFALAQDRNIQEIVVVDDRIENLQEIQAYAREQQISVQLVLLHKKGSAGQKEEYRVVKSVRNTERTLRRQGVGQKGKTLWVFDFNRTLLNTDAFEKSVMKGVEKMVRRGRDFRQGD